MATCFAAAASSPLSSGPGNLDEFQIDGKLVVDNLEAYASPALGEKILHACVMAAVEIAAARPDHPADAPLLQGGEELDVASSPSTFVAEVPAESQGYVEAIEKGLHDPQENIVQREVVSSRPVSDSGGVHESKVSQVAKVVNQDVSKDFTEQKCVYVSSSELNNTVSGKSEDLQVPKIKYHGTSEATADSKKTIATIGETEEAQENSSKISVNARSLPVMIASDGYQAGQDSPNIDVSLTESVHEIHCQEGKGVDDFFATELEDKPAGVIEREGTLAVRICEAVSEATEDIHPADCADETTGVEYDVASKTEVVADGSLNIDEHDLHVEPDVISESTIEVSDIPAANFGMSKNVDNGTTISQTFSFTGLNHVAFCVENLERSLNFYCDLLGLKTNRDRPELPYRGAWLFLGAEGIHIMEVPNPDPVNGRPHHGGFDRHACLNCKNVEGVRLTLEKAGIPYQPSIVPSLFARDPDGNGLEFIEVDS